MLGYKDRDQGELLISGSLRQLLPNDYILVRVELAAQDPMEPVHFTGSAMDRAAPFRRSVVTD